jgi:hypothetical protein
MYEFIFIPLVHIQGLNQGLLNHTQLSQNIVYMFLLLLRLLCSGGFVDLRYNYTVVSATSSHRRSVNSDEIAASGPQYPDGASIHA